MGQKYTVEEFVEVLKQVQLVDPYHMRMVSNGHGEFPDGYKLTEMGAKRLGFDLEQLLLLKEDTGAGFQGDNKGDGLSGFRG